MGSPYPSTMQIFVKRERTYVIDVEPTDTVLVLKEKIGDIDIVPVEYMVLTHCGKLLDDARTMADYGIGRESTVYYRGRLGSKQVAEFK